MQLKPLMAIVWLGTVTLQLVQSWVTRYYLVSWLQQFCLLRFYLLTMPKQLQRPEVVGASSLRAARENFSSKTQLLTDRQATQVATELHFK